MTPTSKTPHLGDNLIRSDAVLWMIDDNIADLEIGEIVCETIGFSGHFCPFTNGPAALSRLAEVWAQEQERPDVIMLDVNMPRMSGLAVLRALRQDPRWATLPVVMFSTSANEEMFARRDGATDYVVKPSLLDDTISAFRGVIDRFCKRRPRR